MASASSSALVDTSGLIDFNRDKLSRITAEKAWMKDPRYFKKVVINAVAAMKMTTHAAAGVDKGLRSQNGMPVEVMGLMHGHPSTEDPTTMIVTDVFPLPVEGTETMVMAENDRVHSYMIALSEALEKTRPGDHFMGWYHSHPFDVGPHSNAFLSATDVTTQFLWQSAEDNAGNPWLALVVDPLRGVAKGKPEIGAFRCYPQSYTPPKGLAPDGVTWEDDKAMKARWGESCLAYYQLETSYAVPQLTSSLLGILARDFMWTRVLSSTPSLEKEARDRLPERLRGISLQVEEATAAVNTAAHGIKTAVIEKAQMEGSDRDRSDRSDRSDRVPLGGGGLGLGFAMKSRGDAFGAFAGATSSPASSPASSSASAAATAVTLAALGPNATAALSSLKAASTAASDVACECCKGRNALALKDLVFQLNHNRAEFIRASKDKARAAATSTAAASIATASATATATAATVVVAPAPAPAPGMAMAMATDD